jgi:hypothetical protein
VNSSDSTGKITKAQKCGVAFIGIGLLASVALAAAPAGFVGTALAASATNFFGGASLVVGLGISFAGVFGC